MGRPLEFGGPVSSTLPDLADAAAQAQLLEDLGYDFAALQDHPYMQRNGDTWTTLAYVSGRTARIRLTPNVLCVPVRSPQIVAKAAATLDLLTKGRIALALGAGARWDAIEAMGFATRTGGQALQALAEAVEVIRLVWAEGETVTYEGEFYALRDFAAGPRPPFGVPITLGTIGPKALALTGRVADGWTISRLPAAEIAAKYAVIAETAGDAGRDPSAIRVQYNFLGEITDGGPVRDPLSGPVEHWVEVLSELVVDAAVDAFLFWPGSPQAGPTPYRMLGGGEAREQLERMVTEVAPAVAAATGRYREVLSTPQPR